MGWRSLSSKLVGFSVLMTVTAMEALAQRIQWQPSVYKPPGQVVGTPEIDGPAGIAAIALLVSAGIVAYNRLRK